jgi:arylsulfatase A-like enzyme
VSQTPFTEYEPGKAFPGRIGRTTEDSSPAWPRPLRATPGAPNVVGIVLDDTGFGQLGCYGSPIATPNLDALAAGGLLYTNMHTTALCSPSCSCIVTGRNHHANGMAAINELAIGYPGYNGQIPFENGFLSEMLVQHRYTTYIVGKWNLMPSEQESAAGPYERWPLGRGRKVRCHAHQRQRLRATDSRAPVDHRDQWRVDAQRRDGDLRLAGGQRGAGCLDAAGGAGG